MRPCASAIASRGLDARVAAGSRRRAVTGAVANARRDAAPLAPRPRSVSGGSARPCKRPVAVDGGLAVPDERDHPSASTSSTMRSRPVRTNVRAGAPDRRGRTGSRSTTAAATPEQLERRRRSATAAAAARPDVRTPNAGHQNTSLCAHAPLEHEPGEPADRQARARAGAASAGRARSSPASRRRARRPREAACARTTGRRTARRSASGSTAPSAMSRKSRPELWKTFQTAEDRSEREPEDHQDACRRARRSPARRPRCSARAARAAGRPRRSACSSRRGFVVQRLEVRLAHAVLAAQLPDHEQRVGAHAHAPRREAAAPRAARRCSASVLGDVVRRHADALAHGREQRGRIGRRVEHDRADRRRPRVPARSAVAVDRAPRRAGRRRSASNGKLGWFTGRGSRRSCRSTRRRRPRPRRMRSASVDGIGEVAGLARRADEPGRARAPVLLRGGARSRASSASASRRRPRCRRRVFGGDSASISRLGRRDHAAQPLASRLRASPASARRAAISRVERLALLHHLELAVFEVGTVALQHVDVGLHRLQLARRRDRAGVQLLVDLVGLARRGACASSSSRRSSAQHAVALRARARRAAPSSVASARAGAASSSARSGSDSRRCRSRSSARSCSCTTSNASSSLRSAHGPGRRGGLRRRGTGGTGGAFGSGAVGGARRSARRSADAVGRRASGSSARRVRRDSRVLAAVLVMRPRLRPLLLVGRREVDRPAGSRGAGFMNAAQISAG